MSRGIVDKGMRLHNENVDEEFLLLPPNNKI
jgi:hypothetical protein